jgi:GH15 family glucan-1,4-alpha-glucosidase
MGIQRTLPVAIGDPLARHSIDVLTRGQARSGAFIASPAFPVYRYAWLRDGAFCAVALDVAGKSRAARAFHDWVVTSVERHRSMIEAAIERITHGETPGPDSMPPARYTLDGALEGDDDEPWPNFQIDGYGTWLWALGAHGAKGLDMATRASVELVARYLRATWRLKCFNCWEEFDGGEHASTLGAMVAGLESAAGLLEDLAYAAEAERVRAHVLENFVVDGRFRRGREDDRLDGSLLWLGVPFEVLPLDDARVTATVEAIRRDLTGSSEGVYRYRGDTYYGGGQWLLLTSSLAWHDAVTGNVDGFAAAQNWVRRSARPSGDLPEQVAEEAQDPEMVEPWVRRWGPAATPLLWSHAMYLIAEAAAAAGD